MKKGNWKKTGSILLALCLLAQASPDGFSRSAGQIAHAAAVYNNAKVASTGLSEDAAVIRGSGAAVIYDSDRESNVLSLGGGAFGSGWLQLPELFKSGCKNGFTVSMKIKLDASVSSYSRIFQFSPTAFGAGNTNGYNSPDISVDVNDKTAFRASVFAGTGATADDRSIFTLSAAPDSDWHDLTAVYSPDGAAYYLDGKELSKDGEGVDDLAAACASLFSGSVLSSYTYCGIGHSLYNDNDLRAKIDDVCFYNVPLKSSQITAPADPNLCYTFEPDTITEGEPSTDPEGSRAPDGTAITSIPSLQVTSPDGSLTVKFWRDGNGRYYYSVNKMADGIDGVVIQPSRIGLVTTTEDLASGFGQTDPAATIDEHDETYTMPYGKHRTLHDNYTEISFPLTKGSSTLTVILRAYDDGVGLRYSLNHGASIKEEQTQVMFPGESTFWGNWPNNTYEWDMVELPRDRANETNATYSCPYTGVINNRYWVTVSEANVFNEETPYCAGTLQFVGNYHSLRFKGGNKVKDITFDKAFQTPWRAVVIGDSLDQMSSSDLILNLNPPSRLDDISWVKPGKLAWSWWSSGGDSPVEYHTQKDYIDFAAENGWDYVCVDFGWALWDDSAAKVKELCEYGAQKGVGIWLWYGVNNTGHSGYKDSQGNPAYPYYSLLDEATIVREFERISGLGVKGVKVDYYESDTQQTMKQMYLCATIAAKNKLMVLFHGCTLPRGESRTYPNVISFEAVNGSEYYKWFTSPTLENRVSYTFTRNVAGSADFTPTGVPVLNSKATAGFALADVVNIESGLQHFAHSVYTYEGSSALPFLNDVPVVWDDMKVLDGRPMQFNVTARRNGNNWYVGASTIAARKISIKLSELIEDDGTYNAYIFHDNADGSDLEVTVKQGLTKKDVIEQSLLANGGCAIKITKGSMKLTTPYSNYLSYEAEDAKIASGAKLTNGSDGRYSSNGAYVGYIGGSNNGSVTFENVTAPADGEYTLRIYYVSGEPRSLKVDVNGAFSQKIDNCYANKGDWTGIRAVNIQVKLKAGQNSVKLYNDQGTAPSVDRIALAIPNEDVLAGDMNYDGIINAADLTLLKRGLMKGFTGSKDEHAADFNMDGKRDTSDISSMILFLTTQS